MAWYPCCCTPPACTAASLCSGGSLPTSLDVELQDNTPATSGDSDFVYVPTDCATIVSATFRTGPASGSVPECVAETYDPAVSSTCVAQWGYCEVGHECEDPDCEACLELYEFGVLNPFAVQDRFISVRVWMYLKAGSVWLAAEVTHTYTGDNNASFRVNGQTNLGAAPIDCCGETPWEVDLGCHEWSVNGVQFVITPGDLSGGCFWNGAGKLVITPVCA